MCPGMDAIGGMEILLPQFQFPQTPPWMQASRYLHKIPIDTHYKPKPICFPMEFTVRNTNLARS